MADDLEKVSTGDVVPRRMSKTLHKGLRILELLATRQEGATIAQISEEIDSEWSVTQRLVVTLQYHDLVHRDIQKRIHLGRGLLALAEPIDRDLRSVAGPTLQRLADITGATSNLVALEGVGARALLVVEPTSAPMHIAFRAGQLNSLHEGASGVAILSTRPAEATERKEVAEARENGYAITHGEVIPNVIGIAVPIPNGSEPSTMSVGISVLSVDDLDFIVRELQSAALDLRDKL